MLELIINVTCYSENIGIKIIYEKIVLHIESLEAQNTIGRNKCSVLTSVVYKQKEATLINMYLASFTQNKFRIPAIT
jgi:hypothetical protein